MTASKHHPVMEVFGPTVQGEGPLAGALTHFVRLGACDYRCTWCDSLFAVIPEQVKEHATKMTPFQICSAVQALTPSAPWVTLSGGNPALHDLTDLAQRLQSYGFKVAVETQGSVWRDWLSFVDMLVVSPKPPSSRMASERHERQTYEFFKRVETHSPAYQWAYKGVVFTRDDFEWHLRLYEQLRMTYSFQFKGPLYLSAGTDPFHGESLKDTRNGVSTSFKQLCEWVIDDPAVSQHVRVLPQLHVLAWGHARGV
jgi:7-carboxy-7-deazaguanine synthase